MTSFDPCDFLFERWKNLAMWRNSWTILLYVLGGITTIFFAGAIIAFLSSSWIGGAVSTLGTIFNGVAVKWLLDRRNQAVTEETEAKEELMTRCGGVAAAATRSAPGQESDSKFDQATVDAVEKRLTLFGKLR